MGQILSTVELTDYLENIIPGVLQFKQAFATAEVSNHKLARYYLRAMELHLQGQEPYWIPNDNVEITLEHVLPQNPGPEWSRIKPEDAAQYYKRIGNLVLLQASKNNDNDFGNKAFAVKKPILYNTPYALTKQVGRKSKWNLEEIDKRQLELAKIAVETWPLRPE